MIFYTKSTRHFAAHIKQEGLSTIKQFSDGELFVRIDQSVKNKKVWIVASTQSPAEHMLELFFLLDALQRNGAYINLLITYFAYGRQVIAREGEACTAQVISTLLKTFTIGDTYIIHPHSVLLHDFLPFAAVDTIDFFCNQAVNYDAIAAPDKGALDLAQHIASRCNKELIVLTKTRPDHEKVEIKAIEGNVKN